MTDSLPPLPQDDQGAAADAQRTTRYPPPPVSSSSTQPLRPTRPQPPVTPGGHVQQVPPGTAAPATGRQPPAVRPRTASMPAAPRPKPARDPRRDSGLYLPWWSLALMLVAVLGVSFLVVLLIVALGGSDRTATREPVIRIITAVPTDPAAAPLSVSGETAPPLPAGSGQSAPAALALQGPTLPPVIFTATPQPVTVGLLVVVDGVGADELNVRDRAGVLGTAIQFRVRDGSVFQVVEGPQQADGFTWWRVQDTADPARTGWVVANYLKVIEGQ